MKIRLEKTERVQQELDRYQRRLKAVNTISAARLVEVAHQAEADLAAAIAPAKLTKRDAPITVYYESDSNPLGVKGAAMQAIITRSTRGVWYLSNIVTRTVGPGYRPMNRRIVHGSMSDKITERFGFEGAFGGYSKREIISDIAYYGGVPGAYRIYLTYLGMKIAPEGIRELTKKTFTDVYRLMLGYGEASKGDRQDDPAIVAFESTYYRDRMLRDQIARLEEENGQLRARLLARPEPFPVPEKTSWFSKVLGRA